MIETTNTEWKLKDSIWDKKHYVNFTIRRFKPNDYINLKKDTSIMYINQILKENENKGTRLNQFDAMNVFRTTQSERRNRQ